ncbi:MAG: triose-phosphate isomerase [Nitrospinota bacterium]
MKKPLIVGNWKMNLLAPQAEELACGVRDFAANINEVKVVLAPSYTLLSEVRKILSGTSIGLACQNFYFKDKGAFTGEVSIEMVKDAGCDFAIVGHSERRQLFGETDDLINKKINCALDKGLRAIFCVGETEDQRKAGHTFDTIEKQVSKGLEGIKTRDLQNLSIAYEPVWAIGTGENATASQVEEIHGFIRKTLVDRLFGKEMGPITILYGGSVTPDNCRGLLENPEVDGALIGGASLNIDSFCDIINTAKSV